MDALASPLFAKRPGGSPFEVDREYYVAPSFSLVTAALLVAQSPEPAAPGKTCACAKKQAGAAVQYVEPVAEQTTTSRRSFFGRDTSTPTERPILSKIQSWFGKKSEPTPTAAPAYTAEPPQSLRMAPSLPARPTTTEPAALAPQAYPTAPARAVTPTQHQTVVTPGVSVVPSATSTVATTNSAPVVQTTIVPPSRPNRISPDLVSKVGHAEDYSWVTGQIRIENGVHVLHFAPPEVVDPHQGSFVLTSDRDLRNLSDGAYVCVRGFVGGRSTGGTTYRVTAVDVLPRQ